MIQKKDLYSVYTHTSPSGKVYVGVSNNPKRRWGTYGAPYLGKTKNGSYSQSCFASAILKYGWENFEHNIILEDIPFNEALYAEKYLIRWYKIHHISYNMSDGGEYFSGSRKPLSEEHRQKVKEFMNTHHPMKGRHHTEEAKAKISKAAKTRIYTSEKRAAISEKMSKAHKGMSPSLSKEGRKRISLAAKEAHKKGLIPYRNKEVHQYDFNGNYIASYSSITEAAKAVNRNGGDISECANGNNLSAGGYIWSFIKTDLLDVSKFVIVGNKLYTVDSWKRKIDNSNKKHFKAVNQYTLNGEYITTYNSILEAKKAGYSSSISGCCSHKEGFHSANGYKWEYDTVENRKNLIL